MSALSKLLDAVREHNWIGLGDDDEGPFMSITSLCGSKADVNLTQDEYNKLERILLSTGSNWRSATSTRGERSPHDHAACR